MKRRAIELCSRYYFPLYYFTYLEHNGLLYKFGLIDEAAFADDLNNWTSLAVAGRLQKPVRVIYSNEGQLDSLIGHNRETAVCLIVAGGYRAVQTRGAVEG